MYDLIFVHLIIYYITKKEFFKCISIYIFWYIDSWLIQSKEGVKRFKRFEKGTRFLNSPSQNHVEAIPILSFLSLWYHIPQALNCYSLARPRLYLFSSPLSQIVGKFLHFSILSSFFSFSSIILWSKKWWWWFAQEESLLGIKRFKLSQVTPFLLSRMLQRHVYPKTIIFLVCYFLGCFMVDLIFKSMFFVSLSL